MPLLPDTLASIQPVCPHSAAQAQVHFDSKSKPHGSLGRLEELAARVAGMRAEAQPRPPRMAVVVMGADHGVAEEGVSAHPQAVTRAMLANFASGGAAVNVLTQHVGAELVVVDMGTCDDSPITLSDAMPVWSARMGSGTRNFTRQPAMELVTAERAVETGIGIAHKLADRGVTLMGVGDMGIGNTTAASALTAVFTGAPVRDVTGTGTGIDAAALERKIEAIERGLALHQPHPNNTLATLAQVGGFEIAGITGAVLGAAARRVPVVLDGFITSVAALAAIRLCPAAAAYVIPSHTSMEPGHRMVLQAIGIKPLFQLDMRLGEGAGAALAMGMIDAALKLLNNMAPLSALRELAGRGQQKGAQ